jgi:predicted nucleic acid-binding protein
MSASPRGILLDTSVASHILRETPEADACRPHVEGRTAALSFQTVGELWFWAEKNSWGELKRQKLEAFVRRCAVLIADEATARAWAELRATAEASGKSKSVQDLWIAATAKRHDLPLLAEDSDFFSALSITAVRPSDPPVDA